MTRNNCKWRRRREEGVHDNECCIKYRDFHKITYIRRARSLPLFNIFPSVSLDEAKRGLFFKLSEILRKLSPQGLSPEVHPSVPPPVSLDIATTFYPGTTDRQTDETGPAQCPYQFVPGKVTFENTSAHGLSRLQYPKLYSFARERFLGNLLGEGSGEVYRKWPSFTDNQKLPYQFFTRVPGLSFLTPSSFKSSY